MILCVGLAADDTFVHTLTALKRFGVEFDALDMAQLAYSGQLQIPQGDLYSAIITLHGKTYVLGSYQGAWVRLLDIATAAPNEHLGRRAAGFYQALSRLFSAIDFRVINPPFQDCSNFSKLFHAVELASIVGWHIPRSCLTNNVLEAREFVASCEMGVIFKGASGAKTWVTKYDPSQHEIRLQLLKTCPVLFQEQIDGPDVRVHVIADRSFAEIIESPELDYRGVRDNTYRRIELPSGIRAGCSTLTQVCGTPFLGIDFKIQRSTGDWFFLEANSLPCYQGYDHRADGAISRSIVDWLIGKP